MRKQLTRLIAFYRFISSWTAILFSRTTISWSLPACSTVFNVTLSTETIVLTWLCWISYTIMCDAVFYDFRHCSSSAIYGKFPILKFNFRTFTYNPQRRSETAAAVKQLLLYLHSGLRMRNSVITTEKLNHAHIWRQWGCRLGRQGCATTRASRVATRQRMSGRLCKIELRTISYSNPIIWTANYQIRPNVSLGTKII